MDGNATTAGAGTPEWIATAATVVGVSPAGIIGLMSAFASMGLFSLLCALPYLFRLCRGQDVITECRIGKSVVTLSVDSTGNGLHAARKLVIDVNTRKVNVVPSGMSDSPDTTEAGTEHAEHGGTGLEPQASSKLA